MDQPYIAILGGLVIFGLGLFSVFKPSLFWGTDIDIDQVQGKKAEVRKKLVRRRWQVGTVAFLATGAAFIGVGVWQILGKS